MKSYKDLIVYQKSYDLSLEIYRITQKFPKSEVYGISSQMRRAAVSIPSNIAEDYRRASRKEYVHFLRISFGSVAELETQISLVADLGFILGKDKNKLLGAVDEISRMLAKMVKTLSA